MERRPRGEFCAASTADSAAAMAAGVLASISPGSCACSAVDEGDAWPVPLPARPLPACERLATATAAAATEPGADALPPPPVRSVCSCGVSFPAAASRGGCPPASARVALPLPLLVGVCSGGRSAEAAVAGAAPLPLPSPSSEVPEAEGARGMSKVAGGGAGPAGGRPVGWAGLAAALGAAAAGAPSLAGAPEGVGGGGGCTDAASPSCSAAEAAAVPAGGSSRISLPPPGPLGTPAGAGAGAPGVAVAAGGTVPAGGGSGGTTATTPRTKGYTSEEKVYSPGSVSVQLQGAASLLLLPLLMALAEKTTCIASRMMRTAK